jgi:hypothetical protein
LHSPGSFLPFFSAIHMPFAKVGLQVGLFHAIPSQGHNCRCSAHTLAGTRLLNQIRFGKRVKYEIDPLFGGHYRHPHHTVS